MVIEKHKNQYSIKDMCKFFSVSRSGYYDYIKRSKCNSRDQWLVDMIVECRKKCSKTYGYRRVQIWIERNKGIKINHKAILRVMNKYNLLSDIRRAKKYDYWKTRLHKYDNLLRRNFKAAKPNQKWVTDISYIHTTQQGVLYLSIIRDLFDNSIVAYKMGKQQS